MSRAEEPTKNDSAQVRALVSRQVQAWEKRDFAIAADDWLPNGELSADERIYFEGHMEKVKRMMLQAFELGRHDARITPCPVSS
jgi:hypothetical protein